MMDTATREERIEQIRQALYTVYDPELGVNIMDLGLVYGIDLSEEGYVTLTMTLTTPGCPMQEAISEGVGVALQDIEGLTAGEIRLVWDPRWEPSKMTVEGRRQLGLK